jgi:hypothetical protein
LKCPPTLTQWCFITPSSTTYPICNTAIIRKNHPYFLICANAPGRKVVASPQPLYFEPTWRHLI